MADEPQDDPGQWLLNGDLPCLGCQYNLRGLVGPIVACPECGHHNDLRRPEQWMTRDLPLGVRQREHWPASAVMLSLLWGMVTLLAGAGCGGFIGWLFVLLLTGSWFYQCRRWVKACRRSDWAVGVLALLHVCVWIFLAGPILAANPTNPTGRVEPAFLLLIPVAAAGIIGVKFMIRLADREGRFREDWRTWRVPIGVEKDKAEQ